MLIAGADGAISDLVDPLSSRTEIDDLIDILCTAGLTRRTPDTIVVRSVVRKAVLSGVADALPTGQARNVVMLATLAYATRTTAPDDWLPLLPHVLTCLDVPTAPQPYLSLLDCLDGWDAGHLQRIPLAEALEVTSAVLYSLDEPALALELTARKSSLATDSSNPSEMARIRAAIHRASMLRLTRQPTDALAEIERAERMATAPIDPDRDSDRRLPFEPADLLIVKAKILADLEDVDGALKTMDRMWALAAAGGLSLPRDTRPHEHVHAELLTSAGRFAEALDRLDLNVTASVPDDREAGLRHTLLAALYLNLNRPAEAIHHAEIAVGILADTDDNGDLLHPRLHRADALRRLGDLPAALNEATEVISHARAKPKHPVLVDALAMAGDILADLHNTERAIAMYYEARALATEHDLPLASRVLLDHRAADVYLSIGRVDEASAVLRDTVVAIDSDPERVLAETRIDVLNLLAQGYLMSHQPAEALPLLERTVQLAQDRAIPDSCYRRFFYLLGTALSDLGRPNEAIAVLEPALAAVNLASEDAAETDATIRLALARARRKADDAAGALQVLQAVPDHITSKPRTDGDLLARLSFERAKALLHLGRRTDGLRQIASSVDMASTVGPKAPGLVDLVGKIGGFLLEIHEPEIAEQYIRRALDLTSDLYGEESLQFATNLDNLGRARVGQYRAHSALLPNHMALRITQERLGPDHPIVAIRLHNLGHAMIAAGQLREATEFLWEAVRIDTLTYGPNHAEVGQDLLMLASALQNAGDVAAAREAATRAWVILHCPANSPEQG